MSSHTASPRYMRQFHAVIEHQREVHSEERALWHTERAELHEKIVQLEASLRRYQAISSSQVSSPVNKNASSKESSLWSLSSIDGPRHTSTSASATGEEVWRPKTDVEPTRTFSDLSNQAAKVENRLPSISEDVTAASHRESTGSVSKSQSAPLKPSVNVPQIDRNLDGITFKSSGPAPTKGNNIMTPQSPSPPSPSPSRISSSSIELPSSVLAEPQDPYTKDAGHTPLAPRSNLNTDGAASARSSNVTTPTQPETERPPLEPHTTSIRLPAERSDSYFPPTEDRPDDADPELSGPLGLKNIKGEDDKFLNELDSKLQRAASSDTLEPSAVAGASDSDGSTGIDEKAFEQPEEEPKLRIKRSMNFGSAFGAKSIGKGL